jgi:hypothetical protein
MRRMADLPTAEYDRRMSAWYMLGLSLFSIGLAGAIATGHFEPKDSKLSSFFLSFVGGVAFAVMSVRELRGRKR